MAPTLSRRGFAAGLSAGAIVALGGRTALAGFGDSVGQASADDWIEGIGVIAALVLAGIPTASFTALSSSMFPTLRTGDVVIADLRPLWRNEPRGAVAVLRAPDSRWLKRIVGLPGDQIAFARGRMILNGEIVPRTPQGAGTFTLSDGISREVNIYSEALPGATPYLIAEASDASPLDDLDEIVVPDGCLFALGDNRDFSLDSRTDRLGMLPVGAMLGRVIYRLRPDATWIMPRELIFPSPSAAGPTGD